jgi:hypothetical protein
MTKWAAELRQLLDDCPTCKTAVCGHILIEFSDEWIRISRTRKGGSGRDPILLLPDAFTYQVCPCCGARPVLAGYGYIGTDGFTFGLSCMRCGIAMRRTSGNVQSAFRSVETETGRLADLPRPG